MILPAWQLIVTRDGITLAIAILGVVLGIANLSIDVWRHQPRLKVTPQLYFVDQTHPSDPS